MIITVTTEIEGERINTEIGRIEAASSWQAGALKHLEMELRKRALQALVRRAEDVDADAIVGIEFSVDAGQPVTEGGTAMQRVRARGIAVTLAAA